MKSIGRVRVNYTVHPHNKHTPNKHFPHNKHTLFALSKMCLFGEEEDFKIRFVSKFDIFQWMRNWFETESILFFYFRRYFSLIFELRKKRFEKLKSAAMVRSESVEAVIGRLMFSWSSAGAHFDHFWYLDIFVDMVNVSHVVSVLSSF